MSTLTKMALGLMGQLKPQPVTTSADCITQLLRQSQRALESSPLPAQVLSDVLWAAAEGPQPARLSGRWPDGCWSRCCVCR